jgi:putative heme-binding domain-containing protein
MPKRATSKSASEWFDRALSALRGLLPKYNVSRWRRRTTRLRFGLVLIAILSIANTTSAQDNFQSLFNGKDLSGWDGSDKFWSVKDGAIYGETTKDNPTAANTFLIWKGGEVGDFIFKTRVRFSGNNSGVQYRSELVDAGEFAVKGYQADLHKKPEYFGMLYAERWRGIVAQRFQRVEVGNNGKPKVVGKVGDPNQRLIDSEWNELTIIAVGDRQIHQVNGITTMDLTDNHPEAKRKGILALQLHRGPPMTVEFKDIRLRHLKGGDARTTIAAAITNSKKTPATMDAKGGSESAAVDWVSQKPVPNWIWRKDQPTADAPLFMRKSFHVPGKKDSHAVKAAKLYFTCDNEAQVWINGESVGSCPDWHQPVVISDAKKFVRMGKNQIAVKAANRGGPAAFVFKLELETTGGFKKQITSNKSWKLSDEDADKWRRPTFDDSAWSVEVNNLGEFGVEPWGKPGTKPKTQSQESFADEDAITVAEGFKVDLIYKVSKSTQGSWVSLTCDDEGRFYASDQDGKGLFRFTVAESVSTNNSKPVVKVEKMPVDVSGAQGMVWHDGALYFNRGSSPLYKLTDSTGDGLLDTAEEITKASGGGEHGNHAVIIAEDGKQLYIDAGNHTNLPAETEVGGSRVPTWDEDHLLTRNWDPNGHARGRLAPGGWITRFDLKTRKHEVYSIGYRNQYDITLNRAGDLFTYDADMEWDLGAPWYRPTRINHAVSGSDYGWRSGSGKWPAYYEDSLPAVVNIGPGSPTGVVSGQGTKFPANYQDAIFALDWTFGTIYAIHLTPDGAGWRGEQEVFCHGTPLPVTDAIVGKDGALYFATGGRGTDSAVYRIRYVGKESTQPVEADLPGEKARNLRRRLEEFHGKEHPDAVKKAWQHLKSEDRWLRHAARIAIESQPVETWKQRLFRESDDQAFIAAAVALARVGDTSYKNSLIAALLQRNLATLSDQQALGLLRAYALTFIRLGEPSEPQRQQAIAELDPHFPHSNKDVNTELVRLLVYLKSPTVIQKTLPLLADAKPSRPAWAEQIDFDANPRYGDRIKKLLSNQPPSHELNYAFMLRNLRDGWTMEQRRDYVEFINRSAKFNGGVTYGKLLANLRNEFLSHMNNDQRAALADISSEDFNPVPQFKITPPQGPGKKWTLVEAQKLTGREQLWEADFKNGRNLFHAAQCATCHRFDGLGGDVGPDLTTVKNKFDANYLLESIIEPSKVISDQYASKIVLLEDGRQISGLVVPKDDKVAIYPIQETAGPLEPIVVAADEIEGMKDSSVSQMPAAMLDSLNEKELRDLIAYLLSAGSPRAKVYQKR